MSTKSPGLNPKSPRLDQNTRLGDTGLAFTDVILTERFLLPPEALRRVGERIPETLGEIAELSGIPMPEVVGVIEECLDLSRDLYVASTELRALMSVEGSVLVDMRPDVTMESEPLHPDAKIFHAQSPSVMLPFLRSMKTVVVLSDPPSHAWSAAMALRKMKIPAFLVDGGAI